MLPVAAHYGVLRVTFPQSLIVFFAANVALLFIGVCLITDMGLLATNKFIYQTIGFIFAAVFVTIFIFVDLYGYYLISRLLLEHRILNKNLNAGQPDNRLIRITLFHVGMISVLLAFDIYVIIQIVGWIKTGRIYGYFTLANPDKYAFQSKTYLIMATLAIYTWWAYVPLFPCSKPIVDSLRWTGNSSQKEIISRHASTPPSKDSNTEGRPSYITHVDYDARPSDLNMDARSTEVAMTPLSNLPTPISSIDGRESLHQPSFFAPTTEDEVA